MTCKKYEYKLQPNATHELWKINYKRGWYITIKVTKIWNSKSEVLYFVIVWWKFNHWCKTWGKCQEVRQRKLFLLFLLFHVLYINDKINKKQCFPYFYLSWCIYIYIYICTMYVYILTFGILWNYCDTSIYVVIIV